MIANGQTEVVVQQGLKNAGQIDVHELDVKGAAFTNQNGSIITDNTHIQTNRLNNQNGSITTRQQLAIQTAQLDNAHGQLLSAEKANLAVSGSLNNTQRGDIQAKQLNINAADVDNAGNMIGEHDSHLTTQKSLRNSGSIAVQELSSKGQVLDNTQGQITVDKANIQTAYINNQNGNITTA